MEKTHAQFFFHLRHNREWKRNNNNIKWIHFNLLTFRFVWYDFICTYSLSSCDVIAVWYKTKTFAPIMRVGLVLLSYVYVVIYLQSRPLQRCTRNQMTNACDVDDGEKLKKLILLLTVLPTNKYHTKLNVKFNIFVRCGGLLNQVLNTSIPTTGVCLCVRCVSKFNGCDRFRKSNGLIIYNPNQMLAKKYTKLLKCLYAQKKKC